jgi:hypothetical protein
MMYVKFSTKIDDFVEIGDTTWLPEAIQVSDLSNTKKNLLLGNLAWQIETKLCMNDVSKVL